MQEGGTIAFFSKILGPRSQLTSIYERINGHLFGGAKVETLLVGEALCDPHRPTKFAFYFPTKGTWS